MIIRIKLKKLGANLRAFLAVIRDCFRGEPEVQKQAKKVDQELQLAVDEVEDLEDELREARASGVAIATREVENLEAALVTVDKQSENQEIRNEEEIKSITASAVRDVTELRRQVRLIRQACKGEVTRTKGRHVKAKEPFTKARSVAVLSIEKAKEVREILAGEKTAQPQDGTQK
jgi:hypothetical protein